MRLFKLLVKKCLREITRNIKQFISIIFIIGISITLYIGLDANASNFKSRVDEVYQKGNIADEWLTINPQFDNFDSMDNDLEKIKYEAGEDGKVETRFYMQSTINTTTLNALIYDKLPKINCAYDARKGEYDDNNFFFIDQAFQKRYSKSTNIEVKLNSVLPVSFDTTLVCRALENLVGDEEFLKEKLYAAINDNTTDERIKVLFQQIIDENIQDLQVFLQNLITDFNTNVPNVILNLKVNGIMSHPENIENGEFSSSNYLLSSRLLLNSIIDNIASYISSDEIVALLNSLKGNSTIGDYLFDYLISYFDDPANKIAFDAYVDFEVGEIQDSINNRNTENIENFITHLYNQIIVKLGSNTSTDTFEDNINNYYNAKGSENNLIAALSRSSYPSIATTENEIQQARALSYCFPIIFFVVAILIVLTTISQLVLRERTQIGTLKALGLKNWQIYTYYIAEMVLVGLVGVILGFIVGPLLLPRILNIKYKLIYAIPAISYTFPWVSAIVMLLVILGLIALLTYLLLRKEINFSASESMRAHTPQIKLKTQTKFKLSTSLMIALRNIRVHLLKSIMVLIGVMGCTGLLICGFGIDDVLNKGRDNDIENFYAAELTASVNLGTPYGKAKEEYLSYEFVDSVEEYAVSKINVVHEDHSINTPLYYFSMKSEFFKFDDDLKDGHWNKEGIGISSARAKELNVEVGDEVVLTVNGENKSYKIEAIFYVFATSGVYIYNETIPDLVSSPTHLWVNIKDEYDLYKCKDFLNENSTYTHSAATIYDNMNRIDGYMSSVRMMTNTVKVFAILLAVVVLLNLGILNFNERIREIATLKVIGFNRINIAKSLIYEMMILVFIGSLFGLLVGMPFEIMVLSTNETTLVSWNYYVAPLTYIISILISLITSIFVSLGISLKIKNVSMTESLKSIE